MEASEQEPKKPRKKIFKAAVIDTSRLVESQARDIGDQRMTESKDDRSAGFLKRTATRIWKHNLAQEFYRQREIGKAKKQIIETGNLYAGEEGGETSRHKEAVDAIIDRFTSEYDMEMLKDDERESKQVVDPVASAKIRDLIKEYAGNPEMGKEAFVEEQTRILSGINPEYAEAGKHYSDNLFSIATEVRKSVEHGEKLAELDFDVELTLGKARESLNTEAQMRSFDKITEKLQNSKLGRYIANSPAIIGIAAAGYSALSAAGLSVLRSNAAKMITFGGSAVVAGGIAGFKESARLERERAQHMRESAKGQKFEENAERRAEMDKNKYETRPAKAYIDSLQESLAKVTAGNIESAEAQNVIKTLAELESRIKLGDKLKSDFIEYSRFDQVEQERTQLDLLRAKLKVALRKDAEVEKLTGGNFNEYLEQLSDTESSDIQHNEIFSKDNLFKKMKHAKVANTVVKTVLIGAAVGLVGQEVLADVGALGHTDGLISGWMKSAGHFFGKNSATTATEGLEKHATIFEALRRSLTHESPRMPFGHGTEMVIGNTHMKLPEGVEMHANPDHTYDIVRQGEVIGHHEALSFDKNGDLTPQARVLLAKQDIFADFSHVAGHTTQAYDETPANYIKETAGVHNPTVHRELWYDNDTPKPIFDKNELKEWWGGEHNTGIDKDGNFIFNMKHMMPKGSYHADQSVDAPAAIKSPGLKMLFSMSRDTQHQPFELEIGPDGNAIVPKDSEIAKLLFENVKGHAVFKGQFAEVAQSMGNAHDGAENVRILSTYVGKGLKTVVQNHEIPTTVPAVRLDIPSGWDATPPPFIAVPFPRRPLERGKTPPIDEYPPKLVDPRIAGYYYGGTYESIWREMEQQNVAIDSYSQKFNGIEKTWVDKDGNPVTRNVEREQNRMRAYLEAQDAEYLTKLKEFEKQVEPMSEKCRVAVIIPARFEEKYLDNLLEQYSKQVDSKGGPIDQDLFEINIIVNRKEGEAADKSIEVINAWKAAHPESHVNVIDVVFSPDQANVGNARKYITDLVLSRSINRSSTAGPLYIESEDADLVSVDRRTVSKLIQKFDEKPYLDVLRGVQDRQPEILQQNGLLFFERRMWDMMEAFMRREAYRPENMKGSSFVWNRVISGGWNTAYTAESYAQIGGYLPDTMGEDMKIGQKISLLRGRVESDGQRVLNTKTAETSGLRANSSPRRFLDAMIKERPPYENFDDQSLKGKTIEELLDGVKKYAVPTPAQKSEYENAFNTLRTFLGEQMVDDRASEVFARTLTAMGLRQNIDFTYKDKRLVSFTDAAMPRIIELLNKYKEDKRYLWGYQRQNTPLDVTPAASNTKQAKPRIRVRAATATTPAEIIPTPESINVAQPQTNTQPPQVQL